MRVATAANARTTNAARTSLNGALKIAFSGGTVMGFSVVGLSLLGLGVLLVFAGLELCPLVRSLKTNEEYFVALTITGIALAVPNMAWAFGIGIAVDFFLRKLRIKI